MRLGGAVCVGLALLATGCGRNDRAPYACTDVARGSVGGLPASCLDRIPALGAPSPRDRRTVVAPLRVDLDGDGRLDRVAIAPGPLSIRVITARGTRRSLRVPKADHDFLGRASLRATRTHVFLIGAEGGVARVDASAFSRRTLREAATLPPNWHTTRATVFADCGGAGRDVVVLWAGRESPDVNDCADNGIGDFTVPEGRQGGIFVFDGIHGPRLVEAKRLPDAQLGCNS